MSKNKSWERYSVDLLKFFAYQPENKAHRGIMT